MKEEIIVEGKAKIKIYSADIVSKDLPVFYNPRMKLNRDLTVSLLNAIENLDMALADPMAGTGIRAVRLLKELNPGKIKMLNINDISIDAINHIKESIESNNLNSELIELSHDDANLFLLKNIGFDYVDIDPFGSPNQFLDAAVRRVARNGVLAVTATDTAPLCGTYPKTGQRKYWAQTIRNEHKHEAGVRILIRKCQLVAAQYERAIIPILSYTFEHYMRIFFRVYKGKQKADEIIKQHKYFHYCSLCANHKITHKNRELCCDKEMQMAGLMWAGKLHDQELIEKMVDGSKTLMTIKEESKLDIPFFYDIHTICKKHSLPIPRTEVLMQKIRDKGFNVCRTHFLDTAIKTDMSFNQLIELMN